MAGGRTFTGARARVGIFNPATGKTNFVGIFQNISWGLSYQAEPVYILGKYAAAEIDYTSQDVVQISCSGWRVIEHGPHQEAALPKLQDLLTSEYIEIVVADRQREAEGKDGRVTKFRNVRPLGYSTSISARQLQEISVNFVAILVDDESTTNNEHPSAMQLP